MSNVKCPICNGDLIQSEEFPCFYSCQSTNWKSDADELCELDDCAASVPVWEALRRTRKALDVAKDTIRHADWFFDGDYNIDAKTMHNEIKYAIKAITALYMYNLTESFFDDYDKTNETKGGNNE